MHPMAAKWIPPNERSKFVSNMMGRYNNLIIAKNQFLIYVLIYVGYRYLPMYLVTADSRFQTRYLLFI